MVLDYILDIQRTQGTNAKLELLKAAMLDDNFRKVLYYAYNPFYNYYIRKIPAVNAEHYSVTNTINSMFILLDNLRDRIFTGNLAIDLVGEFIKGSDAKLAEVLILILGRDLKMGVNTTSINKVYPGLIPTFDVMLAESKVDIDKVFTSYDELYVQKKSDGKRCIVTYSDGVIKFFARSGKEMDNLYTHDTLIRSLHEVRSFLTWDYMLDGEMIIINEDGTDADRQYSNGLINRKNLDKASVGRFTFVVWDILPYEEFISGTCTRQYVDRLSILNLIIDKSNYSNLKVIETYSATDSIEVHKITHKFISKGFEGSIVKTPDHYYERRRSKSWIKFKQVLEADLRVVGFVYGTKGTKYESMLGALELESQDGLVKVSVGSGFTDSDRNFITKDIIGSIITVQYNQLIENKNGGTSLYLPVFIEIREDKVVADDLYKIKNNG